jgi:hypothetical protein
MSFILTKDLGWQLQVQVFSPVGCSEIPQGKRHARPSALALFNT